MKVRAALVAFLACTFSAYAGIVIEEFPASLALKQAVRLGDGSVLPAGPYDVQIHYKGFGNAAEFWFLQGGALKGKSPAEARGFSSQPPPGSGQAQVAGIKGESTEDKHKDTIEASTVKLRPADPGLQKGHVEKFDPTFKFWQPAGSSLKFSWEKAGFRAGQKGVASPGGPHVKISFDSANSAAGFSALLPAVQRK